MMVYLPLFYLHHQQRYFLVRNAFTVIIIFFIAYFSITAFQQGRWTDTEIIMFGVFAGSFFLYSGLSRSIILVFIVAMYFGLKAYKFYHFQHDFDINFFLTLLNISIALCSVAFFMAMFEKELKKNIDNIIKLNLDLTYQKKLVEIRESELKETNKTNNKLFTIIAHDLRSPLQLMNGLVDLCDSENITDTQLHHLKSRTQENLKSIIVTMDNVLIWAKSNFDGFNPKITTLKVHQLCLMASHEFNDTIKNKKLEVSIEIDPVLSVKSDETLLKIIFRNILTNAIKYSNSGGKITIDATLVDNKVCLRINDNGIGFKPETLEAIIKGEFVYSQIGTAQEKGTGLGLHLCAEMLNKTDGKLEIKSVENEGSSVIIYLPYAMDKAVEFSAI
jgi:signal transduction histidine kinase